MLRAVADDLHVVVEATLADDADLACDWLDEVTHDDLLKIIEKVERVACERIGLVGQEMKQRKSLALALIWKNGEAFPVVIIEKKCWNELR